MSTSSGERRYPSNWKKYWLSLPDNCWLCDIPDDFISDQFNLYGLDEQVRYLSQCVNVILGSYKLRKMNKEIAQLLMREELPKAYGLIHARYIISPDGIRQMEEMYNEKKYGTCPRVLCNNEPLLPYGISSKLHKYRVKGFCPVCRRLYQPRPVLNLDGGYFGPNAAHIIVDEECIIEKCNEFEMFKLEDYQKQDYELKAIEDEEDGEEDKKEEE